MDLRTLLLKFYFNVESAYYEFLDVIDNYAPVYEYLVNPLENRGYPSFPVFSLVALFIIAVLFFYAAGQQVQVGALSLLVSSDGTSLPGAKVVLSQLDGNAAKVVGAGVTDLAGSITFVGIPVSMLTISVEKRGYDSESFAIETFPAEPLAVNLAPSEETAAELASTRQAWKNVGKELQGLAEIGYPEFMEAIQRESEAQRSTQGVNR